MYLDSIQQYQGYWWIPSLPDQKVSGNLVIQTNGEIELNTIGNLTELPQGAIADAILKEWSKVPVILGFSTNGKNITLVDCLCLGNKISFPGITTSKFIASTMLVGLHFQSANELKFSSIETVITGFDEWLGIYGHKVTYCLNHEDSELESAQITYRLPPAIDTEIDEKLSLKVDFCVTIPAIITRDISFHQKAYLKLNSAKSMHLTDWQKLLFKLCNFLCLATNERVAIKSANLDTPPIIGNQTDKSISQIQTYYKSGLDQPSVDKFNIQKMLFCYEDIANEIGAILNIWLTSYTTIEPVFNLYFALIHKDDLYIENMFLNLVQGLETLHRRTTNNSVLPNSEHQERIKRILESVSVEDDKTWLEERLKYSNEPPLRRRIKDLIEPFKELFGSNKIRNSLILKIVDTRNYFTHYDQSLIEKAAKGNELYELKEKLRILFIMHILLLIGFPHEKISGLHVVLKNRYLYHRQEQ
jgi:hypothetical protein